MIYKFPAHFIWKGRISKHEELKDHLKTKIKNSLDQVKSNSWDCEVISSFHEQFNIFSRDEINEIVFNSFDSMMEDIQSDGMEIHIPTRFNLQLPDVWYNYYDNAGHYQEVHDHRPSKFSGIYFLELEGINTTTFYNRHENLMFDCYKRADDVQEGDVILFPSTLLHYVNPVKGKKITISFNIDWT